jgi:uncharacterized OB-fold protein
MSKNKIKILDGTEYDEDQAYTVHAMDILENVVLYKMCNDCGKTNKENNKACWYCGSENLSELDEQSKEILRSYNSFAIVGLEDIIPEDED